MKSIGIPTSTLQFLKDLNINNNRDWFKANKERYQTEHGHMIAFADALLDAMNEHDHIETINGKKALFRIYRDVRFSKDKSPYKNHFSGYFRRATKWLRGGYYFHIEPGNTFVGGGFWGPNAADLKRIRQDIAFDDKPLRKVINSAAFKRTFGTLDGNQLKTAPKGYPKDHPAIDLLRYKQFLISRRFTDEEVMSGKLVKEMNKAFKGMRPFFNYMSEVLTTDANGIPIE